jgi:putative DNA primase/helicase
MPTKDEMRAMLNLAPPDEEEPFDLDLEMNPPKISGGQIIPSRPKSSLLNLDTILRGDPMFAGDIKYSELKQNIMVNGKSIADHDVTEMRLKIASRHRVEFKKVDTNEVLELIAYENRYHPVRDWLTSLVWDGVPRLDTWLTRWAQVIDTPLHRAYARKTCIGAVRRVMEPGAKLDTVLVLHGAHGKGKSTLCQIMAHDPAWYSNTKIDWDSKEKYVALQGVWIYELAELAGKRKADQDTVKNYISSATDKYRPWYGKHTIEVPRTCAFFATTNDDEPLHDPTGNRRWWVVSVDAVDTELVKAEYEQVWAEAMEAWRQGEQHWLEPELEQQREEQNSGYETQDPLFPRLVQFARAKHAFTVADFLEEQEVPASQWSAMATKVGMMMARIGTHRRMERKIDGAKVRRYEMVHPAT